MHAHRMYIAVYLCFEECQYWPTQLTHSGDCSNLRLMTIVKEVLTDLENSLNFWDSMIDIFVDKNRCMELKYGV
jgi:hypothetical protein